MSIEAARKLEEEGYSVEVIDLRSLLPLDEEAIMKSVKKTGKVLVAHEDKVFGGFGGELDVYKRQKLFSEKILISELRWQDPMGI